MISFEALRDRLGRQWVHRASKWRLIWEALTNKGILTTRVSK